VSASAPPWHRSGWFAIVLLVGFLACMSQAVISGLNLTMGQGLSPEVLDRLRARFVPTAIGAVVFGALLVRGIVRPGQPDRP
jgi:hypothetical protein